MLETELETLKVLGDFFFFLRKLALAIMEVKSNISLSNKQIMGAIGSGAHSSQKDLEPSPKSIV